MKTHDPLQMVPNPKITQLDRRDAVTFKLNQIKALGRVAQSERSMEWDDETIHAYFGTIIDLAEDADLFLQGQSVNEPPDRKEAKALMRDLHKRVHAFDAFLAAYANRGKPGPNVKTQAFQAIEDIFDLLDDIQQQLGIVGSVFDRERPRLVAG